MKEVKKDEVKGLEELAKYQESKKQIENKLGVLAEFEKSDAGVLVKSIFEEEIKEVEEAVNKILQKDMKAVFLMRDSQKAEHIEQLSKKELILSEVLGVLKTIEGRIFRG